MNHDKQRGVALLWALLLTTVLMVVSGSMASVMVRESRMTVDIESSTQAYANAKTGAEWGRKYIEDNPTKTGEVSYEFNLGDPAEYPAKSSVAITLRLDQNPKEISSVGNYIGMQRKINTSVDASLNGLSVFGDIPLNGNAEQTSVYQNRNSFEFSFDFWKENSTPTTEQVLGVDDGTAPGKYNATTNPGGAKNSIGMLIDSSGRVMVNYFYTKDSVMTTYVSGALLNSETSPSVPIQLAQVPAGSNPWKSYTYRAYLKYVKDSGITLTIKRRDPASTRSEEICLGSVYIAAAGIDFGNLSTVEAERLPSTTPTTMTYHESFVPADPDDQYIGDMSFLQGAGVRYDNIIIKGDQSATFHTITTKISPPEAATAQNPTRNFPSGTVTSVSFTNVIAPYVFKRWSCGTYGGSTREIFDLIMPAGDITCTAYFSGTLLFNVNTSVTPPGSGTIEGPNSVIAGEDITLTASPNAGYIFYNWGGDCASGGSELSVTLREVSSNKNCTANFTTEWIPGRPGTAMAGKQVYYKNIGPFAWGPYNVGCRGPECILGIDAAYPSNYALVSPQSFPLLTFNSYPAQKECKAIGGRLPYTNELAEILNGRATYGNNFGDIYNTLYWTATEYDNGFARGNTAVSVGTEDGEMKDVAKAVRCVK